MVLPSGGRISIADINAEWGASYNNLNSFRGTTYYHYVANWAVRDAGYGSNPRTDYYQGKPETFPSTPIYMSYFFAASPDNEWDCNCGGACDCNCNCACDCTSNCGAGGDAGGGGDSGGGGECFPVGTKITMADGTYKNIEEVQIGDYLLGADQHNKVTAIWKSTLRHRELIGFEDESLFFTSAHPVWVRHIEYNKQWVAVYNKEHAIECAQEVIEKYNKNFNPNMLHFALLIDDKVEFAHREKGWVKPKLITKYSTDKNPDLEVYTFITNGDYMFFANDYLVFAVPNDEEDLKFDGSRLMAFDWDKAEYNVSNKKTI